MCMNGLPEFVPVHHVHTMPVAAKEGVISLGLKLWIVVSYYMGAED